jgi:hypothetical protein
VRALTGRYERAIGEHHVGGKEVVDRETEAPCQVADAASERQAGHTGVGDEAGRSGHAKRHGRVVDVSPGASGVGADGVIFGIDRGAAQQRKVDDQGVVPYREPSCVVAATSDGDLGAVFAAETHTADDVGGVTAARDGGRAFVDHGVVDGARLLVPGISRHDQVTVQGGGQLVIRCRGGADRCGRHVAPLRGASLEIQDVPTLGPASFAQRSRASARVKQSWERPQQG